MKIQRMAMKYRLPFKSLLCIILMMSTPVIAYPRKTTLKKLDHVTSLAITASSILFMMAGDCEWLENLGEIALDGGMAMHALINGLALKYDKSPTAFLKLLLPSLGIIARVGDTYCTPQEVNPNNDDISPFEVIGISTLVVYWVKSIWDIRALRCKKQGNEIILA